MKVLSLYFVIAAFICPRSEATSVAVRPLWEQNVEGLLSQRRNHTLEASSINAKDHENSSALLDILEATKKVEVAASTATPEEFDKIAESALEELQEAFFRLKPTVTPSQSGDRQPEDADADVTESVLDRLRDAIKQARAGAPTATPDDADADVTESVLDRLRDAIKQARAGAPTATPDDADADVTESVMDRLRDAVKQARAGAPTATPDDADVTESVLDRLRDAIKQARAGAPTATPENGDADVTESVLDRLRDAIKQPRAGAPTATPENGDADVAESLRDRLRDAIKQARAGAPTATPDHADADVTESVLDRLRDAIKQARAGAPTATPDDVKKSAIEHLKEAIKQARAGAPTATLEVNGWTPEFATGLSKEPRNERGTTEDYLRENSGQDIDDLRYRRHGDHVREYPSEDIREARDHGQPRLRKGTATNGDHQKLYDAQYTPSHPQLGDVFPYGAVWGGVGQGRDFSPRLSSRDHDHQHEGDLYGPIRYRGGGYSLSRESPDFAKWSLLSHIKSEEPAEYRLIKESHHHDIYYEPEDFGHARMDRWYH